MTKLLALRWSAFATAAALPLCAAAAPAQSLQDRQGTDLPGLAQQAALTTWSDIYAELEDGEKIKLDTLRSTLSETESRKALELAHPLPVGARGQLYGVILAAPMTQQRAFMHMLTQLSRPQVEDVAFRSIDFDRKTLTWLLELSTRKSPERIRIMLFDSQRTFDNPAPSVTIDEAEDQEVYLYWTQLRAVTNAELAPDVSAPWQVQIFKSGASASPFTPLEVRRERDNYGDTLQDFERWHECGGVLIAERWVLTAAHCIKTPRLGPYLDNRRVRTGTQNITRGGTTWRIAAVVKHAGYDPVAKVNDIALLMLAPDQLTKVSANRDAGIARLPAPADPPLKAGEALVITGWGVTGETALGSKYLDRFGKPKRASPYLMMGKLQNVGWDACNRNALYLQARIRVGKGQICALGAGEVDACQGDSGGPLVREVRGRKTVVGLVSYGMGCGIKDTPGVYIDLTSYRSWIEGAKRQAKAGQVLDWAPQPARR